MKGMGMAKAAMLKELSKEMSNDANSGLKDALSKKGMKKVTVASDSKEGLEKGLSMAEKLMKLKNGDSEDESEESSEEEMPSEEMSEEKSPMEEMGEMSEEEAMAMYEMLKKRFEE